MLALSFCTIGMGCALLFSPATPSASPSAEPTDTSQSGVSPKELPSVPEVPLHIATPSIVHGVYLTSWIAGNSGSRKRILGLFEESKVNSVVIDVKDATGRLSYMPTDPELQKLGVGTTRIRDLAPLIRELHARGIYVIGRVQVFQDPFFAALFPEYAFTDIQTGGLWRDNRGILWLRPNSEPVWEYVVRISRDAYAQGFDEINVDYVRFPSDGNLRTLDRSSFVTTRQETIRTFFAYLNEHIRGAGIPLSADIFGLTTSASDDLGIGQKIELIAPLVDFVCPMIYPSHYALGSFGYANPAEYPYEIIHRALFDGIQKLTAVGISSEKLRPWLQDFDLLGVPYTAERVAAQMQAAEDSGISSWLLWDPTTQYTQAVLR